MKQYIEALASVNNTCNFELLDDTILVIPKSNNEIVAVESEISFCEYEGFILSGDFHTNYESLTLNELLKVFSKIDYRNLNYDYYLDDEGCYKNNQKKVAGTY